jgi:peptidyl-prolyl cis-trans isomerase C
MSDQIGASHILLMYDGSLRSTATRSQDEAQQKIAEIKAEIDGGTEFADAARANSDCPSSAQGGDLGSFGRGMMVPEFEESAFGLEVGATSDVVTTDFGYHLIMRTS